MPLTGAPTRNTPPALVALVSLLLLAPALACAQSSIQLPEIGDSTQPGFSKHDEQALGERFMRELRAHVPLVEDPQVKGYVKSLGQELASHAGPSTLGFTFFVVDEPAINAFAGPGGYIGINAGLITSTERESELASVVAHEIAHVTQRHLQRTIAARQRMSLPSLAGLAAAILIGIQSPEAGQAAAMALGGGQAQLALNYSRQHEREADHIGIQILAKAGFDPRAMPSFFEQLQQASRYYRQPPEFLSTHPVTSSRIADSRARAERYPVQKDRDSLAYHLVRAKLEVAQMSPEEAVPRYRERLEGGEYRNADATLYGLALALLEAGEVEAAREHTYVLLEADPDRIPYIDLQARTALAGGSVREALGTYEDALELYPGDRVLTRGYVEALLRAGRAKRAVSVIEDYQRSHSMDADMYRLAAHAHQEAGNTAASQAALAEHYYRLGRLDAAIHQLRLAGQAVGDDYYQTTRLEARLRELEEEKAEREGR